MAEGARGLKGGGFPMKSIFRNGAPRQTGGYQMIAEAAATAGVEMSEEVVGREGLPGPSGNAATAKSAMS
jgi:hypothetical protein